MPRWWLVEMGGPRVGARYELHGGEWSVGREPTNDFVLPDLQVSRRHAVLRIGDGRVEVHDLGSTNGTFVNGERLGAPRALGPGDAVRFGQTDLAVEVEAEPVPAAPEWPRGDDGAATAAFTAPAEDRPAAAVGVVEPLAPPPPFLAEEEPVPPPLPQPAYVDQAYPKRVLVAALVLVALIVFVIIVLLSTT